MIDGANHFTFSDDGALWKSAVVRWVLRRIGMLGIDGCRQLALTAYCIHSFFDAHLKTSGVVVAEEIDPMESMWSRLSTRIGIGLSAGAVIVYVDNFAFEGEVSPIVIVIMLLVTTASAGAMWRRRGWVPAAVAWACVPLAHVVKHALGLPDTLQPNTYTSILYLAVFSLVVATVGTVGGILVRRPATGSKRSREA